MIQFQHKENHIHTEELLVVWLVFLTFSHYNYCNFVPDVLFQLYFTFPASETISLLLSGVQGARAHTHRVNFYLSETNIVQPCQGMTKPSALLYLSPQYLTNSYAPQEITCTAKITAHLGNMPQLPMSCTYVRNTAGAVCLSSHPAVFPPFCRTDPFYPFLPVYIKIPIAILNKDFFLQPA